jgi:hypothetical protein
VDSARVRARDAAARRLRRLTAAFVGAFGALALVFGLIAARAFPGRSSGPVVQRTVVQRPAAPGVKRSPQTAPPLVQIGSEAQPPPAPTSPSPAPAPAPTAAAPVAVSGGS